MATENINIIIREDGSRQVAQNLQQLAGNGDAASRAMTALTRAMEILAAAFAVDKLKEYADEWASVNGIVEVATKTHVEATAVMEKLFDAAQAVRSPIADLAGLYGRAARAATDLGASQEQAIQFTKEVGQALVVQHTTATQASGALLQLGQLLGTGKVRAQEFNSVNENLSVVLQVVARNVDGAGGSVNKLKALVEKGTVGSKEFFEAFLKGGEGLQRDFDKSAFTISQGFTLINNAILKMIGDLNTATGVSNTFGAAAKFVADHMKDVENAIVVTSKLLATGAAAWATYAVSQAAATAVSKVSEFLAFTDAVARGNVVVLGSAEANRQRAVAVVAAAAANVQAAVSEQAAAVAQARAVVVQTEAITAEIVAKQTLIDLSRADVAAKLAEANAQVAVNLRAVQAAEAAGAQSFAIATLKNATVELVAAEAVRGQAMADFAAVRTAEIATEQALTAALGEQAVAQAALTEVTVAGDNAMTAAVTRLAVAQEAGAVAAAAAAGTTTRLAQVFGLVRGLVAPVLGLLGELWALLLANPFTAIAVALVTVTGLLLGFGNKILLGVDGITTLGNVMDVLKSRVVGAFSAFGSFVSGVWAKMTDDGKNAFGQTATAVTTATSGWTKDFTDFYATSYTGVAGFAVRFARTVDKLGAGLVNLAYAAGLIFLDLPKLFGDVFLAGVDAVEVLIDKMINLVIGGLNEIRSALHQPLIPLIVLPDVTDRFKEFGKTVSDDFNAGMQGGIKSGSLGLEKALTGLFDEAQAHALGDREASKFASAAAHAVDLSTRGKPAAADNSKEIEKEREALRHLLDTIDPVTGAILEQEKAQKILTEAVKLGILAQDQSKNGFKSANDYLSALKNHYQDIIDPLGAYNRELDRQNSLLLISMNGREAESRLDALRIELKKKDIFLSDGQVKAERERIQSGIDLARQIALQDSLIQDSVNRRRDFSEQLGQIMKLLNNPASGFTKGDGAAALLKIDPEVLSSTLTSIEAVKAQYTELFGHIKELRAAGVIDDATATRLQVENAHRVQQSVVEAAVKAAQVRLDLGTGTWADLQLAAIAKVTNGFTTFASGASAIMGDFFTSFEQGFADSVGKAVVESQNLGDALHNVAQQAVEGLISALVKLGIQWLVNQALQLAGITATTTAGAAAAAATATAWGPAATLASIATEGGAAAVGEAGVLAALTATKAASLPGLMTGGYTGNAAVDEPAAIAHGQEFVVNAPATAKNRELLEAMNAGKDVSMPASSSSTRGSGAGINVKIANYGTSKQFEVQHLSPNDVRIIARDEVSRNAPNAVATQLANPNSQVSKAVGRHTSAQRSRF